MTPSSRERRRSALQLLAVVATMLFGYVCIRTLRFTNAGLNLAFVIGFFITPLFAIPAMLRLEGWRKALGSFVLLPFVLLSLCGLFVTISCDVPAAVQHRELSRELSAIDQGSYSVHLVWQETAGGAVGPHGVSLQQRRFIVPGLYLVKYLDYFEGASAGSIVLESTDKIRLQIAQTTNWRNRVDRSYSLKRWLYF